MARLRSAGRRFAIAIASGLLLSACAVSFDGYKLGRDASAGSGGTAPGGAGGTAPGGAGGTTPGGAGGTAPGGAGGTAPGGSGGTAPGGAGGTTTGGTGGTGGSAATGGTGGSAATGGTGGSAATGGTGGSAATGGTGGSAATGGTGGSGGTAATGGTGGTGPSCPTTLSGPSMVYVPAGAKGFCIDSTEVTNKQYESFLKSSPSSSQQIAACSWNSGFNPNSSGTCSPSPYDPSGMPDSPISCVNWCDAMAYCAWAGKRLCGYIGGGANNPDHSADPASSQWYAACSQQGQRAFPYGNTYQGSYCNDLDYPNSVTTIPVKQDSLCVGGYDGIYDMSGNVSEWVDSCTGSNQSAQCLYRGGSYLDYQSGTSTVRCDSAPFAGVSATTPTRGFRCCYDL